MGGEKRVLNINVTSTDKLGLFSRLQMPKRFSVWLGNSRLFRIFICLFVVIFQASFGDSYSTLQLYRSYTSPSDSYLQINKPSRPVEVRRKHMRNSLCEYCWSNRKCNDVFTVTLGIHKTSWDSKMIIFVLSQSFLHSGWWTSPTAHWKEFSNDWDSLHSEFHNKFTQHKCI